MISRFAFTLLICALTAGCAHSYKFRDAAPVTDAGDRAPSPVPAKTDFNFVEYSVSNSVRHPLTYTLDTRRKVRSQDVNALDEVPASSWFTPRLGTEGISPEEMVKGATEKGEPQLPVTIIKAKTKGNSPGFIIKDARGLKYLIKFDRTEYPALESTANFVVNRLFRAFGYNVPEDFIFYFPTDAKDYKIAEGLNPEDVETVLLFSHAEEDGRYRSVASLFLEGEILGPISPVGTRKNDANDKIAHENRRTLRALRLFCAWLDNSGMRSDNTLDVYTGQPGAGHTVHYILDFGEVFGIHGFEKQRAWDGFEHFYSWEHLTRNVLTLGVPVKKWERLENPDENPAGTFESQQFEPGEWKEGVQFMPIRSSQPDDDYWAAKIIAAVKPEHLKALFQAADHPDKDYAAAILETLLKRRDKVLRYALSRVAPLEPVKLDSQKLILKDLGREILNLPAGQYQARFLNTRSRKVALDLTLQAESQNLEIPLAGALKAAGGYLIVEIRAVRDGGVSPRAAQFHIRDSGGVAELAGVVH